MIYICHGDDNLASYNRLQSIISNYKKFQKISFGEKDSGQEFISVVNSTDLISSNKIYVLENFISQKKIAPKTLLNINSDNPIIFWEKLKILTKRYNRPNIKIDEFKLPSKIFSFLDSIRPSSKLPLLRLNTLDLRDESSLLWQLSNRFYLLLLFKLNIARTEAESLSGKPILDWQWTKISDQAKAFNTITLKSLFTGILRIDYMIKSGKTDMQTKSLISVLFIKYLKP